MDDMLSQQMLGLQQGTVSDRATDEQLQRYMYRKIQKKTRKQSRKMYRDIEDEMLDMSGIDNDLSEDVEGGLYTVIEDFMENYEAPEFSEENLKADIADILTSNLLRPYPPERINEIANSLFSLLREKFNLLKAGKNVAIKLRKQQRTAKKM